MSWRFYYTLFASCLVGAAVFAACGAPTPAKRPPGFSGDEVINIQHIPQPSVEEVRRVRSVLAKMPREKTPVGLSYHHKGDTILVFDDEGQVTGAALNTVVQMLNNESIPAPPSPDFKDMVQFESVGGQDNEIGITPRLEVAVDDTFIAGTEEIYVGSLEALHTFLRTHESSDIKALVRDRLAFKLPEGRKVKVIKIGFRKSSGEDYEPFCVIDYSDYAALQDRPVLQEYGVIAMWRLNSKLWFNRVETP